jgi:hypothetical protein
VLVDEGFDIGIRDSWLKALDEVRAEGGKPYAIPAGASVHKFGGLGYVGFAEEVRAQEAELGFKFDYIVVCTVTGSTHAGMLVGFAADGRAQNVIGIDASFTPAQTRAQVLDIAQKTAQLVDVRDIVDEDVVLIEDYAYPAYGVPSAETSDAMRLVARLEGMITDPVYEGKSMQGLIDLAKKGYFPKGSRALRASGRRARAQRLQLHLSQRLMRAGRSAGFGLSSDGERRAVHHLLHHEERARLPHAGQRDQLFAVQAVELGHVGHADLEEIVEITRHQATVDHVGHRRIAASKSEKDSRVERSSTTPTKTSAFRFTFSGATIARTEVI